MSILTSGFNENLIKDNTYEVCKNRVGRSSLDVYSVHIGDSVLPIFFWYGSTGEQKCKLVISALNNEELIPVVSRFVVISKNNYNFSTIYDSQLQITVFTSSGDNHYSNATKVANALNSVDHGRD